MSVHDVKDMSPNEDTIRQLEMLLEHAKKGELRSFISVCGWDDDAWSHGWSIDYRNSRRRLVGEMTMLHFDIATKQSLDDDHSVLYRAFE